MGQKTQKDILLNQPYPPELFLLFDASRELSSTLSYEALVHNFSRRMITLFSADECIIADYDSTTGILALTQRYSQASLSETEADAGPAPAMAGVKPLPDQAPFPLRLAKFPAWQASFKARVPFIIRLGDPEASLAEIELLQQWHYASMAAIPLVSRDTVTGLVGLFFSDRHGFVEDQVWLAQALVNQASIAIENARLFSLTDQQLQKRVEELAGLQSVSQELNSTLDLDKILNLILEEALRVTQADFGQINLDDGKTVVVANTFDEVEVAGLRDNNILSKVAVPIYHGTELTGVINLESKHPDFFKADQLRYLEALANQAAVAIGNAQAYQEQKREREQANQRANQLSRLAEISNAFRTNRSLHEVLEDIAYAIVESVGYDVVLISLIQGTSPVIHHRVGAGIPVVQFEALQNAPRKQPLANLQAVLLPEFRLSHSYFIPAERRAVWQDKLNIQTVLSQATKAMTAADLGDGLSQGQETRRLPSQESMWQAGDILFIPLADTNDDLIGLLTLENPHSGRRPTLASAQTLEIFANHAAAAIENTRLFELEQRRRRLADTLRGVAETISSQLEFDELLNIVLRELKNVVDYDSASVQLLDEDRLVIIGGQGWQDNQQIVGLTFSLEDDTPNRRVLETQEAVIVNNAPAEYPASFAHPPHQWIKSWLGVPLTYGFNILGLLSLDSSQLNFFTQEDAVVALAFANQVAVAFQNAQLFAEARQQVRQLAALTEVAQSINRALNLDEVLDLVLDAVFNLVEHTTGLIWLIDTESETVKIVNTKNISSLWVELFNKSAVSVHSEPFASVINSGEIVVIEGDAPRKDNVANYGFPYPDDVTYIPLKTEDGIIGILAIEKVIHHKNTLQLVKTLADLAAVAIDNAQLVQRLNLFNEALEQRVAQRTNELAQTLLELEKERDRVETLYQITRELSTSFDLDRILTQALRLINQALGIAYGSILLLDRETGNLFHRAAMRHDRPLPRGGYVTKYKLGYGLAGKVIQDRQPRIISDLLTDPDWVMSKQTIYRRSAIVVPLIAGEDALGAVLLFHNQAGYFTEDHLKLITAASAQLATALNNAELYQLIVDQTHRLGTMLRAQATETAKNEAILNSIADGVLVLNDERNIVLLNPKAAEILNVDAEASKNQSVHQVLGCPESPAEAVFSQSFYDNLLKSLTAIEAGEHSAQFRLEAGHKAVVVTLAPVSLGLEKTTSVVAVLSDISKEAELERIKELKQIKERTLQALRQEQNRLKAILNNIADGVIVLDTDDQIITCNPTARQVLADVSSELPVVSALKLLSALVTNTENQIDMDRSVMVARLQQPQRYPVGSRILSTWASPVKTADGEDLGTVIVLRDTPAQIDLLTLSPFVTVGPTSDKVFFGREQETQELMRKVPVASYAIIGGRRIGKSSLLSRLHRFHLSVVGCRTIYHDCSITPTSTAFLAAPIHSWQPEPPAKAPPATFEELLHFPPSDMPLVLLLDEADKLIPADRAAHWPLFSKLRALTTSTQIQIVLSGERALRKALRDPASPLFNFVNEILLGPLDYRAVEELITQPIQPLEIELVDKKTIVRRIYDFTSGHPNIVQRLCRRLIERLDEQGTRRIRLDDVNAIIEDPTFQREDFLGTYWESATLLEKIISLLMANDPQIRTFRDVRQALRRHCALTPKAQAVDEALRLLVDMRSILRQTATGYEFAVESFPNVVAGTMTLDDMLEILTEEYQEQQG